MHLRTLGAEGPKISEVGLGCWQLGGSDWGDLSEQEAMAILQTSVESGVNFFDTADVYGLGRSESLIGKFLKETTGGCLRRHEAGALSGAGLAGQLHGGGVSAACRGVARATGSGGARPGADPLHPDRGVPTRRLFRLAAEAAAGGQNPAVRGQRGVDGGGEDLSGAGGTDVAADHLQYLPPEADRIALCGGGAPSGRADRPSAARQRPARGQVPQRDAVRGGRPSQLQSGWAGVQCRRDLRGPAV